MKDKTKNDDLKINTSFGVFVIPINFFYINTSITFNRRGGCSITCQFSSNIITLQISNEEAQRLYHILHKDIP